MRAGKKKEKKERRRDKGRRYAYNRLL